MSDIDCDNEALILSDDMIFYTIEGEGKYVGMRSVFMRLSMCNLTCIGFASADSPHGCDSYISWSVKNKTTFNEIFKLLEDQGYLNHLRNGAIWKITGGEPLIQQKQLRKLVQAFIHRYKFFPTIDFETNGTLMPDNWWLEYVEATFTVSPKLSSNGDAESKTYKPEVLKWHRENGTSTFKFVITRSEDIDEIWKKYVTDGVIDMPKDRIWFMPCAGSRAEHEKVAATVAEYAKQVDVNFSPRLHLVLWNQALRV